MIFEWDEAKRVETLEERGLDFVSAYRFFDGRAVVIVPSPRGDEDRWKTTAMIEGTHYTLVWMWRGDAVRVISMRRAHDDEERAHRALHG
jgi:uncharacterized DUF497 family protein